MFIKLALVLLAFLTSPTLSAACNSESHPGFRISGLERVVLPTASLYRSKVRLGPKEIGRVSFCQPTLEDTLGYSDDYFYFSLWIESEAAVPLDLVFSTNNMTVSHIRTFYAAQGQDLQPTGWERLERNYPAFHFQLDQGQRQHLVLEIKFAHQTRTTFYVEGREIEEKRSRTDIVIPLLCSGVVVGLLLYNLFLFISLRKTAYALYVLTISAFVMTLYYLSGFHYLFFQKDVPDFAIPIWGTLMLASTCAFAANFLGLRTSLRHTFKLLCGLTVFAFILCLGAIFSALPYPVLNHMADGVILLSGVSCQYAAYRRIAQKFSPAVFYAISWGFALLACSIWFAYLNGLTPEDPFYKYSLNIGLVIEMIVISLALADLVNVLRREFIAKLLKVNDELEAKVQERTERIKLILHTIKQGIFMIDETGLIETEHSRFLEEILGTSNIGGRNLETVLLPHARISEDLKSQILSTLSACLGEPDLAWSLNEILLPRNFDWDSPGGPRQLEVDWQPNFDKSGLLKNVLVTIRDISEINKLTREAEQSRGEVEIISEMASLGPAKIRTVLKSMERHITANTGLIERQETWDAEVIHTLFRNAHTLKGEARTYRLRKMAALTHEIEQSLATQRDNPHRPWNQMLLLQDATRLATLWLEYKRVSEKVFGSASPVLAHLPGELLASIKQRLEVLVPKMQGEGKQQLEGLIQQIGASTSLTLFDAVRSVMDEAAAAAAMESGKPKPGVVVQGHANLEKLPLIDDSGHLNHILIHLVSNSMAHSIERPDERVKRGKPVAGILTATMEEITDDTLALIFSDDGSGLNISRIIKKAVEKGYFKTLPEASETSFACLQDLVLRPGFSTAHHLTDLSGRGVGMDAVMVMAQHLGGTLSMLQLSAPLPDLTGDIRMRVAFRIEFKKSLMLTQAA